MKDDCLECGKELVTQKFGPPPDFCSTKCRNDFRNRRTRRGALAYDLVMNWRFNRGEEGNKAYNLLCRFAATWNQEDKEERDGRRSYQKVDDVIQARPHMSRVDML